MSQIRLHVFYGCNRFVSVQPLLIHQETTEKQVQQELVAMLSLNPLRSTRFLLNLYK